MHACSSCISRLFTCHLHELKIHAIAECNDGEVRLVGGDADISSVLENQGDVRGLINVCENEQWSYICDADWTMEDTSVACRELGYSQPGWFFLYIIIISLLFLIYYSY